MCTNTSSHVMNGAWYGRYGKPWLQKKNNPGLAVEIVEWDVLRRSKGDTDRCVSLCRFRQDRVRQNGKGQSMAAAKKRTARNINVDGFSGEESVACLVVPCSPQRALPLAGTAGRRKKTKKRNVCVSVLCGSGYLLFTPLEGIQLVI